MIQRIQTIFLLLAIVAMALFLYFPLITTQLDIPGKVSPHPIEGYSIGEKVTLSDGVYTILITSILIGTAAGLTLINIFLFKKRKIQMAVCWFAVLFVVSAVSYVYYRYITMESIFDHTSRKVISVDIYFTPWNLTAAGAIVFLILAFIFIRKDEELIQSMDRLR